MNERQRRRTEVLITGQKTGGDKSTRKYRKRGALKRGGTILFEKEPTPEVPQQHQKKQKTSISRRRRKVDRDLDDKSGTFH